MLKHITALEGRPRQHQHVDAVFLEGAAGGCAHGVVEYGAVHRQQGLLDVVFRHFFAHFGLEPGPDFLQDILVELQFPAKRLTDGLFGEIVVSGSQAPGGNNNVRSFPRGFQRLGEALGIVAHHRVVVDRNAHGA